MNNSDTWYMLFMSFVIDENDNKNIHAGGNPVFKFSTLTSYSTAAVKLL